MAVSHSSKPPDITGGVHERGSHASEILIQATGDPMYK